MQIDLQRMDCASFGNIWSEYFGTINVDERCIIFDKMLDIKTYFVQQKGDNLDKE